jgi:hypothetical protein
MVGDAKASREGSLEQQVNFFQSKGLLELGIW